MAAPNIPIKTVEKVRDELNAKSPSFCLAKWLQVTIHLQNGQTHSCHHPKTHRVPDHELQKNPSALHNTTKKMLARKEMLEGLRPSECEYCWNIEDAHPENLSDRSIKSAQIWSYPRMNEVKQSAWSDFVNPSYVEVSFGNECNFKCAYCAPHISSSIMKEVKEFGPYSAQAGFSIDVLKEQGLFPYGKDENNPFVDAFWNWWPDLVHELKVFRITGGEPLLNQNTFKFLDMLKTKPMPGLTFAVNSNLGVPKPTFEKFLVDVKEIVKNKRVKEFQLFTSVDTYGSNAEFVRFGMNYKNLIENMTQFLETIPECELIIMCAFNAFSVVNFSSFLKDVSELKSKYLDSQGKTRVTLDIPYLKDPTFLSCYVLTQDFIGYVERDILYMKTHNIDANGVEIYYQTEIAKLERIHQWMSSLEENEHRDNTRRELSVFLDEYCSRKGINHKDYVPEYESFISYCKSLI